MFRSHTVLVGYTPELSPASTPGGCLIVLHWLNAQLAMIQSGFVKLERVFLAYAQDAADVTVCGHLKEQKFSDYSLTEGESPVSQQARARDGR
jgi:hypothetical protein